MSEITEKDIGRMVEADSASNTYLGRVAGKLCRIYGNNMVLIKDYRYYWCFTHGATLLPEPGPWKPKPGEWVAYANADFTTALVWDNTMSVVAFRPLADEERIDICGGKQAVLDLAKRLEEEEACCPSCGGRLGHLNECALDKLCIHQGESPKDFYKEDHDGC